MPIGYLRIQAVTSRARVPVENATVTISGAGSGGLRELISVQLTDDSGQTPPVSVETPAAGNSLSPDQAQGWTEVSVSVSHPDYDGILVQSVQIFPGVTTVQDTVLIPRGSMPGDPGETDVFDTPDQGL